MRRRGGRTKTSLKVFLILVAGLVFILVSGCAPEEADKDAEAETRRRARSDTNLRLVYPEWSSEIASAHLIQAVLQERMGYRVQLIPVKIEEMWRQVAEGKADILTGAWLPTTHKGYYDQYREQLEDLGPNLVGARIGLVVPTVKPGRQTGDSGKTGRELVTIRSIPEMAEFVDKFNGRIIGIESGAGVVSRTREALDAYSLEAEYHIVSSDEERMLNRLSRAVQDGEWIVFTGWKPHWVFELYNLRFLDDPQNVFGEEESIHTMVRKNLKEEEPPAYNVLQRISYESTDLERLMRWIYVEEQDDAYAQAVRWIEVHSEMVDSWVKGLE